MTTLHDSTDEAGIEYVTWSDGRFAGTAWGGPRGLRIVPIVRYQGLRAAGTGWEVRELIERGGGVVSAHATLEEARATARVLRQQRMAAEIRADDPR